MASEKAPTNTGLKFEKPLPCRCGLGPCVEVAMNGPEIAVRDSKLGNDSPILIFNRAEWSVFIQAAKAGQYD